jgi:putative transposase
MPTASPRFSSLLRSQHNYVQAMPTLKLQQNLRQNQGDVLDILVQSRLNTKAADRFFRKLFKQYGQPGVLVTDKLGSYGDALRKLAPGIDHRAHKGLNNRAEVSHRPTRRREKIMGRFKSPRQAQRFLSVHDQVQTIFRPRRHKLSTPAYRQSRSDAHSIWDDITCELTAG